MSRSLSDRPVNAKLSDWLEHRMDLYCLAAVGVSMLALAPPAEATVVITNKKIPIPRCDGLHACPVKVDLNNDGTPDFSLVLGYYGYGQNINAQVHVTPLTGGEAMGARSLAFALVRGAKIGPSAQFASTSGLVVERSSYCTTNSFCLKERNHEGYWGGNHPNRFLGVKFLIHGKTHYGWIRITITTPSSAPMSATITEYGYESVANKSCGAGLAGAASAAPKAQTTSDEHRHPSLGMLALGADGLSLWRREEELTH